MIAIDTENHAAHGPCSPLVPDIGCRQQMLWRTELNPTYGADEFRAALIKAGLHDETLASCRTLIWTFAHPDSEYQLVFVPRTGRIQIRLGAITQHADRVPAAKRVYDWICQALETTP